MAPLARLCRGAPLDVSGDSWRPLYEVVPLDSLPKPNSFFSVSFGTVDFLGDVSEIQLFFCCSKSIIFC